MNYFSRLLKSHALINQNQVHVCQYCQQQQKKSLMLMLPAHAIKVLQMVDMFILQEKNLLVKVVSVS